MSASICVMVADERAILREGVRSVLEREAGMKVVAEVGESRGVVDRAAAVAPHVLVLDLFMRGLSGFDVFRALRAQCPKTKILVFSEYLSDELVVQCLRAGAKGYLPKTAPAAELVSAIKTIHAGGVWADQTMMVRALEKGPSVTRRELEIIRQISAGMRNREIAAALGISEKTVKAHLHNIFKKLKVEHRVQVALYSLGIKPTSGEP